VFKANKLAVQFSSVPFVRSAQTVGGCAFLHVAFRSSAFTMPWNNGAMEG